MLRNSPYAECNVDGDCNNPNLTCDVQRRRCKLNVALPPPSTTTTTTATSGNRVNRNFYSDDWVADPRLRPALRNAFSNLSLTSGEYFVSSSSQPGIFYRVQPPSSPNAEPTITKIDLSPFASTQRQSEWNTSVNIDLPLYQWLQSRVGIASESALVNGSDPNALSFNQQFVNNLRTAYGPLFASYDRQLGQQSLQQQQLQQQQQQQQQPQQQQPPPQPPQQQQPQQQPQPIRRITPSTPPAINLTSPRQQQQPQQPLAPITPTPTSTPTLTRRTPIISTTPPLTYPLVQQQQQPSTPRIRANSPIPQPLPATTRTIPTLSRIPTIQRQQQPPLLPSPTTTQIPNVNVQPPSPPQPLQPRPLYNTNRRRRIQEEEEEEAEYLPAPLIQRTSNVASPNLSYVVSPEQQQQQQEQQQEMEYENEYAIPLERSLAELFATNSAADFEEQERKYEQEQEFKNQPGHISFAQESQEAKALESLSSGTTRKRSRANAPGGARIRATRPRPSENENETSAASLDTFSDMLLGDYENADPPLSVGQLNQRLDVDFLNALFGVAGTEQLNQEAQALAQKNVLTPQDIETAQYIEQQLRERKSLESQEEIRNRKQRVMHQVIRSFVSNTNEAIPDLQSLDSLLARLGGSYRMHMTPQERQQIEQALPRFRLWQNDVLSLLRYLLAQQNGILPPAPLNSRSPEQLLSEYRNADPKARYALREYLNLLLNFPRTKQNPAFYDTLQYLHDQIPPPTTTATTTTAATEQ